MPQKVCPQGSMVAFRKNKEWKGGKAPIADKTREGIPKEVEERVKAMIKTFLRRSWGKTGGTPWGAPHQGQRVLHPRSPGRSCGGPPRSSGAGGPERSPEEGSWGLGPGPEVRVLSSPNERPKGDRRGALRKSGREATMKPRHNRQDTIGVFGGVRSRDGKTEENNKAGDRAHC